MADPRSILIVVHPGSACGSADFNLGHVRADAGRRLLVDLLDSWQGGVVILDGALSDELHHFTCLRDGLRNCYDRAAASNLVAVRRYADDPDQVDVTQEFFVDESFSRSTKLVISGAWYDPADEEGCVNSVRGVLRRLGYSDVEVDNSALKLDYEQSTHRPRP